MHAILLQTNKEIMGIINRNPLNYLSNVAFKTVLQVLMSVCPLPQVQIDERVGFTWALKWPKKLKIGNAGLHKAALVTHKKTSLCAKCLPDWLAIVWTCKKICYFSFQVSYYFDESTV